MFSMNFLFPSGMVARGEGWARYEGARLGKVLMGENVFFLYSFLFLKRNHSALPNTDG